VSDLTEALREAGHEDVAAALEKKEWAGRLRNAGRDRSRRRGHNRRDTPRPRRRSSPPSPPPGAGMLATRFTLPHPGLARGEKNVVGV
jgi:hypothetical protein